MSLLSWAALLTALLVLLAGLAGLLRRRIPWLGPVGRGTAVALAGAGLVLLAALAVRISPGPLTDHFDRPRPGPPYTEQPDRPRDDLHESNIVAVVEGSLGPSNRGLESRTELITRIDVQELWLALRANNAPSAAAMRRDISRDAWRVFQAVYTDPQFDRFRRIVIAATHPTGRPPDRRSDPEPIVALISLDRTAYGGIVLPRFDPARDLDGVADVHWLPPLSPGRGE